MKELLKRIIIEYQEFIPKIKLFKRKLNLEKNGNYVFIGSRRAGKTYTMYQIIHNLLENKVLENQILYINFEDERLIEFKLQDMDTILEVYKELYQNKPICFFDEIQNIIGWEKFARRLADQNYKVFITGSNAQMLSKEIATVLGGRFLIAEIQTLSFSEFLNFNGLKLIDGYEYKEQRFEIQRLFSDYFYFGAFPETIKFQYKKEYLSNLYQKVFYGDVVTRYNISHDFILKLLMKKIAESTTDETSFNRLKHIIKSAGFGVSTSTLIDYFGYLEDSFLAFSIQNFKSKFVERESKKKFYFNDTGILNLFLSNPEAKLLETLVFNTLRRKYNSEIYYYKNNYEVDFYLPDKEIIQVAYKFENEQTRTREINSINKISAEIKASKFTIVNYSDEAIIQQADTQLNLIPAWKWCLRIENM